jgi:signal peptidase I
MLGCNNYIIRFPYTTRKDPDGVLTILGHRPAVIMSGSMKSFLNPGDMTISKVINPRDIRVGDVVTYKVDGAIPNTHRVVDIINQDGKVAFETKGDASSSKDSGTVSPDHIIGKFIYKIPKSGYVYQFLKIKLGFTLVIIIPLVLITIFELMAMFCKSDKKSSKGKDA